MRLNGLDVHVEVDGAGPPLLLLHGFTGSTRSWDDLRSRLADCATLIAIDVIGHGRTAAPPEPERYAMDNAARDLVALLDALELRTVRLLGYSMGGRVALYFAVHHPERLDALILESASPGIADMDQREKRAHSDDALADRLERDGLAAFIAQWERQPLLASAPHVPDDVRAAQHAIRLGHSDRGLANSLRGMGTGRQPSLWADLARLEIPTLLLSGSLDQRYCAIAERMQALLPAATHHVIREAGHTAHVDQPAEFAYVVRDYFENSFKSRNVRNGSAEPVLPTDRMHS